MEKFYRFFEQKTQKKLEFRVCESLAKWSEVVVEQAFKFIEPIFASSQSRDLWVQKFVIRVRGF